jgi:putative NADH-flavin reductase
MKLALFGSTGTVGAVLLERVRSAGHCAHALVRSPCQPSQSDPDVSFTVGNALDASAVDRVIAGTDAVLSTLGGVRGPDSLSAGTALILQAMKQHHVRRLVLVQGFHLHFPGDPRNFGQRLIGPAMRLYNKEIVRHSAVMAATLQRENDLDWTVVRIPRISGRGPSGHRREGLLRLGPWSTVTSGDVADFTYECLERNLFIHQAPMVAS